MFETRFIDLAQVEVRKRFISGRNPTFLELGVFQENRKLYEKVSFLGKFTQ
jgi:hypothetical protein